MCRRTLSVFLLAAALATGAKNTGKLVAPKELVEYVLEASRLGLKEKEIQENAAKAGWPDALITQAINTAQQQQLQPPPAPPAEAAEPQPQQQQPETPAPSAPAPAAAAAATPRQPSFEPPAANVNLFERREDPPAQMRREPVSAAGVMDDYRIGAGDVLQINVWDEPKASVPNAVVRPDGRISLPLIKEVEVLGLSPKQAEKLITERMSVLIPNVEVTVVVSAIHSKKIYAIGAVKKEGPIPYTYKMTVLQALSEAGGLNDYAKRRKIYILRTEQGKQYRLPFDYDAVLKGQRMEFNLTMQPNDTLVVPR